MTDPSPDLEPDLTPGRPGRRSGKKKTAYEKAQNANYMNDRRQRTKRLPGCEFQYESVENLPPIEIDANGFAKRPPSPPEPWNYNFSLEQRKVRFLLMWNYGGGNWTLAEQFAGVSHTVAEGWVAKDKRMAPALERARREIADRMRLRLFQVAGLVAVPARVVVNTQALLGLVKDYGISMPVEAAAPEPEPAAPAGPVEPALGGIPRPGASGA